MNRTLIIAASLLTLTATGALADRIDARQAEQEARIREGVRSGQLTWRETAKLEAEQSHIRAMERRAKADGIVTRREAAAIERAQDAASRDIYREKHDSEKAWRRR